MGKPEEIKVVFEEFQVLELSMKDWKSFVQENWYMLLGDYTRDIGYILDGMVERYGKEETFRLIKEDPYLLRTWKEE